MFDPDTRDSAGYAVQGSRSREQVLLNAVEQFARERHSTLTRSSIQLSDPDDVGRLLTGNEGYLLFNVQDVRIEEQEEDYWYVSARIVFRVNEGEPVDTDPDTYECYQLENGTWSIEWHSC